MDSNEILTYGQKMVGITFNQSNDPSVDKIKRLYAEVIDTIMAQQTGSTMKNEIKSHAIKEAMTAQMWAVKAVTWKA